jgi:hypothetical protein
MTRREAGLATNKEVSTMDPAAIATANIGLERIRREAELERIGTQKRPRVTRGWSALIGRPAALVIARALRSVADRVEPMSPAVGGRGEHAVAPNVVRS